MVGKGSTFLGVGLPHLDPVGVEDSFCYFFVIHFGLGEVNFSNFNGVDFFETVQREGFLVGHRVCVEDEEGGGHGSKAHQVLGLAEECGKIFPGQCGGKTLGGGLIA